jgi:hypothetical protein
MTLLAMLRFIFWTILELIVLWIALADLMDKVDEKGFHWFKTPFMACLIILGYLCVIFKIIEQLNKKG